MRASEITKGGTYYDGKQGVREVLAIKTPRPPSAASPRITYRILAAKAESKYSYADEASKPIIDTISECDLASFAAWAKSKITEVDREPLLIRLMAKKIHLPPGEKAFMLSLGGNVADRATSLSFNDVRQARGVEKKKLLTICSARDDVGSEVTLTPLGIAWLRNQQVSA